MQTYDINQFRQDIDGVIAAAQKDDVQIVENGRVLAVVTAPPRQISSPRPMTREEFEAYWQERERILADVIVDPLWDSTQAISEDRDRV